MAVHLGDFEDLSNRCREFGGGGLGGYIGFLERLAGAVLVAYYQMLASTFSYLGAEPSPMVTFGNAIAAALPGTQAPSTI